MQLLSARLPQIRFAPSIVSPGIKNLLMPLLFMGCFPVDFRDVKTLLRTKRPIKVGKLRIEEGKRPIRAIVLVGISAGCSMGCFGAPCHGRKQPPQKGPSRGL